jgi:hypothetical protein
MKSKAEKILELFFNCSKILIVAAEDLGSHRINES